MVLENIFLLLPSLQVVVDNLTALPTPPIITPANTSTTTLELLDSLLNNIYLLLGTITALLGGPLGAFIFKSFQNGKQIQATANTYALLFNQLAEDRAKTKSILKVALTLSPGEIKEYLEKPEVRAVLEGSSENIATINSELESVSKGMPSGARAMVRHAAVKLESGNA